MKYFNFFFTENLTIFAHEEYSLLYIFFSNIKISFFIKYLYFFNTKYNILRIRNIKNKLHHAVFIFLNIYFS